MCSYAAKKVLDAGKEGARFIQACPHNRPLRVLPPHRMLPERGAWGATGKMRQGEKLRLNTATASDGDPGGKTFPLHEEDGRDIAGI